MNAQGFPNQQRAPDEISELVKRVTFHSESSGYCVLRLKVKGERELVTLLGYAPSVTPGEYASARGSWVVDKNYGRQFNALALKIHAPTTLARIEKALHEFWGKHRDFQSLPPFKTA